MILVVVPYINHANDPIDPGDIDVVDDADNLGNLLMIDKMTTNELLEQHQKFDVQSMLIWYLDLSHMRIGPGNQGIFKTMHLMIDDLFVCQLDAGTSPPIP